MPPNGRGTWCVRAIPRRQRRAAPAVVTSAPRKCTAPAFGCRKPARTLSSVVFPAPLGPTMPTASSPRTAKSTSCRTTSEPKRFRAPTAARIGVPSAESTALATLGACPENEPGRLTGVTGRDAASSAPPICLHIGGACVLASRPVPRVIHRGHFPDRPLVVRLQFRADRHPCVVRVARDHVVELVLAALLGLDPLATDDRRRGHVRYRAVREVDEADGRDHLQRVQSVRDGGLALRVLAVDQRLDAGVEQGHRRAELLVPLPPGRLLVSRRELLGGHLGELRAVREGRVPVDAAREVVSERAECLDLRREETGLRDLRDLDAVRVALLCGLPP